MIRAILFDMDGVIVDSLHYHYLAWDKMFSDRGGKVSEHTVLLHEGRNSREILPILIEETKVHIPENEWDDFIDKKREYYRSIVELKYFPMVFETIQELKNRGLKTALVTASARKNMEKAIPENKRKLFDVILTAENFRKAKPNPDPYIEAQKRLGVSVNECVVVENAPLGIEAAKNAGMICIAVETTLGREYLTQADFIINSINELIGFFPILKK
ncbi:MAG: HAD family phosphatase [Ignavibacteria bacterium]|jgi:beta-phosphoglucomutase|nr:HAD family phosphatase [Ignavibacteria bacterium]MDH7527386.1 HAD family phosphatase [Ignavibacteria bacterium]